MYLQINQYITTDPQEMNDILIVDGSDEDNAVSPDLSFYNTIGIAEYLSANRLYTKVIKQNDLKIEHLKLFRGFLFYHVTYTNLIHKFVKKAEYFNKRIFILIDSQIQYDSKGKNFNDFVEIHLNERDIFIPDLVLKESFEPISSPKKRDYLFLFNRNNDSEFISQQIENNIDFLKFRNIRVNILIHINNKSKLIIPEKLSSIVNIDVYRNIHEKFNFIKNSKVVIFNESNGLESFVNELEYQLSLVHYVKSNNLLNFEHLYTSISTNNESIIQSHSSIYSNSNLYHVIKSNLHENIVFNVAATVVRGGINVIVKHGNVLRTNGKDVTLLTDSMDETNIRTVDGEINVVSKQRRAVRQNFDKLIATLWITCFFVESYPDAKRRMYLVQGFETDFSKVGDSWRLLANNTYRYNFEYLTVSKWCMDWLDKKYKQKSKFCPNGLNTKMFNFVERDFSGKIRILIEGSNKDEFRNIDESFKITNQLDPEKYEVWYLTYDGEPKPWYKYKKFLHKIPYEEVKNIYQSCHILLKSSKLESFSYPPLEMMSTGGIAIVALNSGNSEYVKHEENCMVYKSGNIEEAKIYIEKIVNNIELRNKLILGGLELAKSRDWSYITDKIINLYK